MVRLKGGHYSARSGSAVTFGYGVMGYRLRTLRIGSALFALAMVWHQAAVRSQDHGSAVDGRRADDVDALLTRHLDAVAEYRQAFADLVADEVRLIELFNDKGKLE